MSPELTYQQADAIREALNQSHPESIVASFLRPIIEDLDRQEQEYDAAMTRLMAERGQSRHKVGGTWGTFEDK